MSATSPLQHVEDDTADDSWAGTHEAARDLARAMIPGSGQHPAARTVDDLRSPPEFQAQPSTGHASDLAQPGGFRRLHVLQETSPSDERTERVQYARQPLTVTLRRQGRTTRFVTDVLQTLEDGTTVRYESRQYRKGRMPQIVRTPSGVLPKPAEVRYCGFKPLSVPYWVCVSFIAGAVLFTIGSIDWMLPYIGDTAHGAPPWAAAYSMTYPFFVGGLFFILGCYLSFVEVINANLEEEIRSHPERLDPAGSVHRRNSLARSRSSWGSSTRGALPSVPAAPSAELQAPMLEGFQGGFGRRSPLAQPFLAPALQVAEHRATCGAGLRWVGWQPNSLLYWGVVVQLLSALVFQIACYAGLPGVLEEWAEVAETSVHEQEVIWSYVPSVAGSVGFLFASYVYVVEVTHDYNICRRPDHYSLGYGVAIINLVGSLLFLGASLCYFAQEPPYQHVQPWEYLVSLWGVRFPFAVGSACFVFGAFLLLPESLSD